MKFRKLPDLHAIFKRKSEKTKQSMKKETNEPINEDEVKLALEEKQNESDNKNSKVLNIFLKKYFLK